MTLSKYDTDFSDAMALKLRLNREARQSIDSDEVEPSKEQETVIVYTKTPYDRNEEIQNLVAKHPGLTPEMAEPGLRELGFQIDGWNFEITDYKTFEQLVEDWSVTEQGCSGTLMFEWYISECKSKATLIEIFADEEAEAVHMKNIETYGETFMTCTNPQNFTYLGAVTDVVKERVAAFGFTYQVMQGGFRRLPQAAIYFVISQAPDLRTSSILMPV